MFSVLLISVFSVTVEHWHLIYFRINEIQIKRTKNLYNYLLDYEFCLSYCEQTFCVCVDFKIWARQGDFIILREYMALSFLMDFLQSKFFENNKFK